MVSLQYTILSLRGEISVSLQYTILSLRGETSVSLQYTILSLRSLLGELVSHYFVPTYCILPTLFVSVVRWERTVLLALYMYYLESLQYKKASEKVG